MFTHLSLPMRDAAGRFGDPPDPAAPHRLEYARLLRDGTRHRRARRRAALRALMAWPTVRRLLGPAP